VSGPPPPPVLTGGSTSRASDRRNHWMPDHRLGRSPPCRWRSGRLFQRPRWHQPLGQRCKGADLMLENASQPTGHGHRRVQVAARDVANGIGHGHHGQPEGQGHSDEPNAQIWERRCEHRTSAAPNTSQNVPTNSAAARLPRFISPSFHFVVQLKEHNSCDRRIPRCTRRGTQRKSAGRRPQRKTSLQSKFNQRQ